jgi:hypothetical protein
MRAPLFRRFYALAIDDGGGRAGVALALLPACHEQGVMDAIKRAGSKITGFQAGDAEWPALTLARRLLGPLATNLVGNWRVD